MAPRKLGKILLYCVAGLLGVIGLAMLTVKLVLDRAPQYQAEIKDWVHARIGYHIAFAHVSPAFRWYGPELYFDRLELRSKDDQRVLVRAAGGRVGADIWQFLHTGKLLAARIEVDSPDVSVRRIGPEKFALASEIELGGGDASLAAVTLDEFPAGTLAIRHGRLIVNDWNAALPSLELRDVNLDLRHGADRVSLAADLRLPSLLGGELRVDAGAHGRSVLKTLAWTALASTRQLSFAGWRELLPEYLSRLGAGTGGFEAHARGLGAGLARADIDFSATDVVTQLADEPSVNFDEVAGSLAVVHVDDRWTFSGRRVRAVRAGRRDPQAEFDASWRGNETGLIDFRARASYLRAEALLPLAGLLPQMDLRERLQALAPTGEWLNTDVNLSRGTTSEPWRLDIKARFRGVGFAPIDRAPGLRGLSGTIAGTESGGRVDIESQAGVFTWPLQLAQPIAFDGFKTTLYWKRTVDELLVAAPSLELKTHDAGLRGQMAWHQPADGTSPILVMAASVEDGNAAQTHLYLPRALLPPPAFAWLNRAFVAGHLPRADLVIQGPIRHFPFRDGTGLFLARAHVDGMTLDYREGWPRGENLSVTAEFRNEGMTAQLQGGRVGGMTLERGDARFVDFKTAELQIHAAAAGDASEALDFLRATPLDAMAEHAFSSVEARGPMHGDVDLYMPFKQFDQRRVLVHAHLRGVSLNRTGGSLAATELAGDADIDGAQVARAEVRGKLLGGAFQMQARAARNRPVARTTLVFNGTMSGEALHSALSLPTAIPIGGSTDWHGVLRMAPAPARERSLRLNGSLAGLELILPDPLAKPAGQALPSAVDIQWPASGAAQIHVVLGSVLRGQLTVESGTDGPQLGRAAVAFGAASSPDPPAFSDLQQINLGGKIDRLDLGGWLKLYAPDRNARPTTNFLRTARFEIGTIDYLGLSFKDVALDIAASESGWHIGIGGPNVVGSIALPGAADPAQPWQLEFERLKFAESHSPSAPQGAAGANPHAIPAINFHAADLVWDERQFGDVKANLVKLDDGIALDHLMVTAANFSLAAKGEWRGKDAGLGRIEGNLSSTDVGGTLKQLGYDAVIEAKSGKVDCDLSWVGAPTAEAFTLATGHVQIALDKGQITAIKPGAGRVLGLASVAALPRRMALDFSDLTDKGLAFDTVSGDFDLRDGSAFTDNVLVKGPAAEIGLIGRVGLKNKDYDQTAVVTGNVSNALPLAAFAGGPVIGAAVLVFTQVFKQPLKGLARGYYRITGTWDNPTVERIKSSDAAASAEVSN